MSKLDTLRKGENNFDYWAQTKNIYIDFLKTVTQESVHKRVSQKYYIRRCTHKVIVYVCLLGH